MLVALVASPIAPTGTPWADWPTAAPAEQGMDPDLLAEAERRAKAE